ncbi:MAG: flagellar hook-associated protein FlgK [Desulfohalobiaceae bacterium]|nr:flagellar hook-associated protein FlgK [Desulfohalobiaceae bacterium]
MGLVSALNSGLTGILANQRQVEITGNNIANVNSPGYSRQSAQLSPRAAVKIRGQYLGQGVDVQDVAREHNRFVAGQIVDQNSVLGQESAKSGPLAEVERIFGIGEDSLASDIDRFFGAWHDLSQNPAGSVERDRVLYEGENLLDSFEQTESGLVAISQNIDESLGSKFDGLNLKLRKIAELNVSIRSKESLDHTANLERDERDRLVNELSKTIGVQSYQAGGGQIGVQLPGGIPLVQGTEAVDFETYHSGGKLRFQVKTDGVVLQVGRENFGGEFKGLLDVRDDLIPELEQDLAGLKYSLITEVNARHEAGYDSSGQTGRAFFTKPTSYRSQTGYADPEDLSFNTGKIEVNGTEVVIPEGNNSLNGIRDAINEAATGVLASVVHDGDDYHLDLTPKVEGETAEVSDFSAQLTTEEIDSGFSGGFNLVDGSYQSNDPVGDPDALNFGKGHLTITLNAGEADETTTEVSIGPGENSLKGIREAINEADAGVNATIEVNGDDYSLILAPRETGDTVLLDAASLSDNDQEFSSWDEVAFDPSTDRIMVELSSTGEVAAAGLPGGAPGDNENALSVHALSNARIVDGEKTFVDSYARISASVGSENKRNTMARDGAADTMTQLENLRESIVGVSLEEEMINLTMFQRGFEASSRFVSTVDEMLTTVLSLKR